MSLPPSKLTKHQVKKRRLDYHDEKGRPETIIAEIRFDDECGNGHNTFSITGSIYTTDGMNSCGYIHDEIAKRLPDLAPLIKWHLCSTDGPMHYVANTIYQAGDRDCWGLRKGEFRQHHSRGQQNCGVAGVPNWILELPDREARYANEKPAPMILEWKAYGRTGEGKERELGHARNSAIWPDATDEQLMQEPEALKADLMARLPALMLEFKAAVESLGFTY